MSRRMRPLLTLLLVVAAAVGQEEDEDGLDALVVDADGSSVAVDAGGLNSEAPPKSGAGQGPRHKELAAEFAARRVETAENTGGETFQFSRMATPVRSRGKRRQEEEAGISGDSDDATRFYMPGKTEAKVTRNLTACLMKVRRRRSSSYHDSIDCFESAVDSFPLNATWYKKLGTLHLLTGRPTKTAWYYNQSVSLLFENAKYKTSDEFLLADGGLQFLRLFKMRDHATAIEVTKLTAFNYTLRSRLSDAWNLYEKLLLADDGMVEDDPQLLWSYAETLASQGQWELVPPILERLGNLEAAMTGLPPVLLTLRLLSDAADLAARRLLFLPLRNASKADRQASSDFIRTYCGRGDLPPSPTYSRTSIVVFSVECFLHQLSKSDSSLAKLLEKETAVLKKDRGGFLQATPLHAVASLGGEQTDLLKKLVRMGVEVDATTRFGHTALHIALAHGHFATARFLQLQKASLVAKDVRQLTPLELACKHVWQDRKELARSIGEDPRSDPCDWDEDTELFLRVKQKPRKDQGGWEAGATSEAVGKTLKEVLEAPLPLPGDDGEAQVDIRKGDLAGSDLLMDYLLTGRPVLLRGCYPNKLAKEFRKQTLLESHGKMRGQVELFPSAELYGVAGGRTANLSTFVEEAREGSEALPKSFAEELPRIDRRRLAEYVSSVVPRNHPLTNLTSWQPPFLTFEGFTYNDTQAAQLQVGPPGSGVPASILTTAIVFVMPFGARRWFLSPPPHAFASRRHPLDIFRTKVGDWRKARDSMEGREVIEVQQHPGDVLVVPRDWGALAINTRETVGYSQTLDVDSLWPAYAKKKKKKGGSASA